MSNEYTSKTDKSHLTRAQIGQALECAYIEASELEQVIDNVLAMIATVRAEAKAEALEEASVAAFNDKKIQGLQRVLIGNWLRNYAAQLKESK